MRNYKAMDIITSFKADLEVKLNELSTVNGIHTVYKDFKESLLTVVDKHHPLLKEVESSVLDTPGTIPHS